LFKAALSWRKNIESLEPDAIYELSENMRADLGYIPRELLTRFSRWYRFNEFTRNLVTDLLKVAAERGHSQAKERSKLISDYHLATLELSHFNKKTSKFMADLKLSAHRLSDIADRGYMPAQFYLFHHFQTNWNTQRELAAAAYWGKRAIANGAKIKKDVAALFRKLGQADNASILNWEKTETYPKLLLKK